MLFIATGKLSLVTNIAILINSWHGLMQRACPPPQQQPLSPAESTWSPSLPGLPGGRVVHPPAETPPRPPEIAGPMARPKLQLGGLWSSRPPGETLLLYQEGAYTCCHVLQQPMHHKPPVELIHLLGSIPSLCKSKNIPCIGCISHVTKH